MLTEHNVIKEGESFKKFFTIHCPDKAVIHAILEGKIDGKIWLNEAQNACLITTDSFNFIAGEINDNFLSLCLKKIPKTKESFLVNCNSSYFFPEKLNHKSRVYFSGTPNDIVELPKELDDKIQNEFQLVRLNEALFEQCQWKTRFLELYQTTEQFLKFAYGAVMLKESQIVAELYGIVGGQYLEIGAFVHEAYRGHRLIPFMVANSMKQYCSDQKLLMCASCGKENISSQQSVIYFGLKKEFDYSVLDLSKHYVDDMSTLA